MAEQLPTIYEPKSIEAQAAQKWRQGNYFHADANAESARGSYTIVIPPPNVTAALHLGHALNNTLQDVLIRFRRMQQYNTLWMPGTDHAGIATQTVVEKRLLAEEGKRRTEYERADFVGRVQAWKDEYESCILGQLKSMGCSCDWERTRFTMDDVCAKAVRANFFKLFKDGLIYRGKRLVNWDPATQTVLADDEVEHETVHGHFWYLQYPLVESVEVPSQEDAAGGTAFQAVDVGVQKRYGAYLPHWTQPGASYSVTFRLADSVPADVIAKWRVERQSVLQRAEAQNRELTQHERHELVRLYRDRIESYLNAGHGKCVLKDPHIADVVANALKHFDGERYDLIAWVIMPNHVHAIVRPLGGIDLSDILHSWKSYTANKANELLKETCAFWQAEYYDHLIRDEDDFLQQIRYILENPAKAGLEDWSWVGGKVSHGQDAHVRGHGQDGHATTGRMPVPRIIEHVTVATTRPETMLGDTAIAMNPSDPRAKALVGKMVRLPIVGREIPIVADEHVVLADPESDDEKAKFSTGFLKVTPAHDPDDWQIGLRHDLEIINVMAPDGSISDKHGWEDATTPEAQALLGMDRFEAREAIVEWFRTENLLEEIRDYTHEVGHSYRSHVPIEPYLSDQWYVAVKKPVEHLAEKFGSGLIEGTDVPANSLAGLALKPLLDERLRFIPERYAKTYQGWLENLRDWPISRQLWWGHQIPIWSSTKKPEGIDGVVVQEGKDENDDTVYYVCVADGCEAIEKQLEDAGFVRDEDVLDTWFSSALWPFSTLGWPDDVAEMKTFYPGDVLCTAREIITLWVSRMVMMGQYCAGDIPFKDVYIHAMIQDGQGRKMSKSLGNGIDPLVAIDSHGADAMRFTLASMTTDTQDIRMPVAPMELPDGRTVNTSPKFDVGRNFCNKLWNASRFAMMNLEGTDPSEFDAAKMDVTDKWILSRLGKTISEVTALLDEFKYNEPLTAIYKFFWNDLCDWYLEWAKPRMQGGKGKGKGHGQDAHATDHGQDARATAQNVLAFALDQTLRMLHPFIPFITEGIFGNLNQIAPVRKLAGLADAGTSEALIVADWPARIDDLIDEVAEGQISVVQNVIRSVRDIRSKYNIAPSKKLDASAIAPKETAEVLNGSAALIKALGGIEQFSVGVDLEKVEDAAAAVVGDVQLYVHGVVDKEAEKKRLEKQKQQIENGIKPLQGKLGNENFVTRAKPEVVEQARQRLIELTEQLKVVEKLIVEIKG